MTPGILVITGHYGAGKSECALALARSLRSDDTETPLTLIDLDVVNPYFRSREARRSLAALDVTVIGNSLGIDSGVDLPAVPGTISPTLRDAQRCVIVDLGGDPAGARAFRQFIPGLPRDRTTILYVVNAYRPETGDVPSTVDHLRAIEAELGLSVDALISNSHMVHETGCEHVEHGWSHSVAVSEAIGRPVAFVTVPASLEDTCDAADDGVAILRIHGDLRAAWMNSGSQTARRS